MTIGYSLSRGIKILAHTSQTPELDAELLLAFILRKNRVYLYAHKNEEVTQKSGRRFLKLVKNRATGMPIAYLTNTKEFYSLPFYVDQSVLIPRPETEELVDLSFDEIKKRIKKKKIRIIDIGTGCGNIGIALIHKIKNEKLNKIRKFEVYLSDISGKALKIAKRNFKNLITTCENISVFFVKTDLFKGFTNRFDIIVSNPPYIPRKDIDYLDPQVRKFEPKVALNGGVGGIEVVKKLISQAIKHLKSDGVLLFEMHERHPIEIKYFLEERFPKWKVSFKKDCFEMWRFAVVVK